MDKIILLSFDLEEFDLPREFGKEINEENEFEVSKQGLIFVLDLLSKHEVKATFFTTTNFARRYPNLIKNLVKGKHEIACHGYYHSDDYYEDMFKLKKAKQELEKITKSKIEGFRAPRFRIKNISELSNFGFSYDSSIHPTYVPGKYLNLFKKRKPHKIGDITEIPLSTLPFIRLPIFWLAFKNSPLIYSKIFTKINLFSSNYTMLVLHPWEFADLSQIKLPIYIKRKHSDKLLKHLENYIIWCKKKNYEFFTFSDFLKLIS